MTKQNYLIGLLSLYLITGPNAPGQAATGTHPQPAVPGNFPDGKAPVSGLAQGIFQNPINPGPDPWMVFHEGNYYLATTQGDAIRIWKAPTLAALKTARPTTVWKDTDPSRSTGMWAPEFHFINNHWYLYYTATSSDNKDDNHRMHVLESAGS